MSIKRFTFVVVIFAAYAIVVGYAGGQCIVRHRTYAQQAAVVQQAAVIAPVVVPQYSTSYDDTAARDNLIRDLTKRIAELEARVAIVETKLSNQPGPVPPPQPLPPAQPKAEDRDKAKPQAKATPNATGVPTLYTRSCVHCHGPNKAAAGLELVDAKGRKTTLPAEMRLEVLRRINLPAEDKEAMPPQKGKGIDKVPDSAKQPADDTEAAEVMDAETKK